MITSIVITAFIWVAFATLVNREKAGDYGVNFIPFLQFAIALIATLVVWLVYFIIT